MPAIPKVIFLYENDALEVRYSDESRLELSPCGAAMVFHPPAKPGEHTRHHLSQQLHKRTQFVTSEHRQKVLQSVDFRNRFAKRPYLCKELLQTHDVVSLYASIEYAKWPRAHAQAKIDILPDGSRKVTSLDEYASLIVSPHGQDFSVCYLSKLSLEQTSHNASQPASPPSLPYQPVNRSGKKTSEAIIYPYRHEQINTECNAGNANNSKANQHHVVQEESTNTGRELNLQQLKQVATSQNEMQALSQENICTQKQLCHPLVASSEVQPNVQSSSFVQSKLPSHTLVQSTPQPSSQSQPNRQHVTQVPSSSQLSSQVLSNLGPYTPIHANLQSQTQGQQNLQLFPQIQPASQTSSHVQSNLHSWPNLNSDDKDGQEDGNHEVTDIWCSPVAHEISSISRSSTPDGLRMTIDSDTTLTHDTSDNEAVRYRQRHSSPTHQSPKYNDIQLPFAKLIERKSSSAQGSFVSIASSSQLSAEDHNASSEALTPTRQITVRESSLVDEPTLIDERGMVSEPPPGSVACHISFSSSHSSQCSHKNLELTAKNHPGGTEYDVISISKDLREDLRDGQSGTPIMRQSHQARGASSDIQNIDPQSERIIYDLANQENDLDVPSNPFAGLSISANQRGGFSVSASQVQRPQYIAPPLAMGNHCQMSNHPSMETKQLEIEKHSKSKGSSLVTCRHKGKPYLNEDEDEPKSSSKVKYIWTTSHLSKNNCPKEWTHPLMLALPGNSVSKKGDDSSSVTSKDRECSMTSLPRPLPLTCPFQHTHKSETLSRTRDDNGDEDLSDTASNVGVFQKGRLKVVLSEGILYRLIPASMMTVVEIYPGDGSVLISQGAKALFFNHFIPRDGQLEERMYSLKSLPPRCSKAFRPIEKMLKTANRFLHLCLSWDKRCGKRNPPCWQKEIVAIVEPLSSSILEECVIDRLGKFIAYSNGRVRIVFDDRTSLYMTSDFSSRFGSSAKMSHGAVERDMVQLLLPSGNNLLVEKQSNGPYNQYLKVANEWIAWVNTSPAERHKFYAKQNEPVILKQAAQLELKKINCFNYLLEHTFPATHQSNQPPQPESSVLPRTSTIKSSLSNPSSRSRTDILSTPVLPSQHLNCNKVPDSDRHTLLQAWVADKVPVNTEMGFISVRQALAQTSSLISDIEHFLEENKS